eukprot:17590-Chlamydomonas_euryale.AAC.5
MIPYLRLAVREAGTVTSARAGQQMTPAADRLPADTEVLSCMVHACCWVPPPLDTPGSPRPPAMLAVRRLQCNA